MPTLRKHQGRQLQEKKFSALRKMRPLKPPMEVMFNLSSYNYTKPKHAVLGKGTNISTGSLPDSMRVICTVNGAVSALPSEDEARTCTVSVLYKLQKHIPQACLPSEEAVWGSKTHRTNERKPKPRPFTSRFILL